MCIHQIFLLQLPCTCVCSDPAFMLVPIDERMINRAHGVFDSMAMTKFRFFRVDKYKYSFPLELTQFIHLFILTNSSLSISRDSRSPRTR